MFYKQRQENSSFFTLRSSFPTNSSLFASKRILHSSFFTLHLNFPSKFLDVDDRSILADALVTLGSFLYAAEAGTHTARHLVLERNLTLHASLLGKASHAHHHRLRTAGRNHVKLLILQTEWLVTKPTSPAEPSSVVMHTLPILANFIFQCQCSFYGRLFASFVS